jgi:chaperone protein EcpD
VFSEIKVLIFIVLSFSSLATNAGVIINGTRVIYNEGAREVQVQLENTDKSPFLLQNWIDDGQVDAMPADISVPFTLSPPISRIEAEGGQVLRVFYTGADLPEDKESVFWLNVLAAPSKSKSLESENFLQVAFRTRIKIFFRPKSISDISVTKTKDDLVVYKKNKGLRIENPTPFHISISKISIEVGGKEFVSHSGMILPKQDGEFHFENKAAFPSGSVVKIFYINDYGGIDVLEKNIR